MNRRTVLKTGGLAAVGVMTMGAKGCGKNIGIYTATVIGTLKELLPLLPNLSPRIKQAIAIAETFEKAYQDGKFADAAAIFENLTQVIGEIVNAIGVMNPNVKLAIAVGGIALRAIAAILKGQAADPVVAAAVAASTNQSAKDMIERMSNQAVIDRVVELVKP